LDTKKLIRERVNEQAEDENESDPGAKLLTAEQLSGFRKNMTRTLAYPNFK